MVLRQLTKEQAKEEVKKLVDKYNRIVESGSIKGYSENGTKKDFITPLFKALGWDVENEYSDDEVRNEEKVSKGRVDYSFRINGIPKFFLEAKALKEDLDDIKFVEQAINYAWHKGCTWAVLTDFEAIKIFNAEWKSANPLQAQFGQTLPCHLFLEKFDALWILSRESFEKKLLDTEAEKWGKKVKKISVDKQLLDDLTKFRDLLNKNILKNNSPKNLSGDELDEAVQRIIDRLIFIRTLEDKELEAPMLQSVIREDLNKRIYKKLNLIFRKIDDIYNSKLFTPHLCENLEIDDEVLSKIINGLFNTSDNTVHYDFSAIDADVLGNIYEQYLGHILKKTDKRAKLAEGKAHRKEQGIYYTPTYVVDYIVKNTVGELAKDKNFDLKSIKILDPACGSGSFLMKAFDYLVTLDKKKNGEIEQVKLDLTGEYATYGRKVDILKNNIFGVDLDPKAVEIAQLNLLLKAAEKKHRLPTLQENIRIGNSLIDDSAVAGDRAFKWEEEFKGIIDNGGFDVVIGNPPYISMEKMKELQPFFNVRYPEVFAGKSDILYYFIAKSIQLLKDGGYFGMIVSRYFMDANFGDKIRGYILKNTALKSVIDFKNVQIFDGVNVLTTIMIFQKVSKKGKIRVVNFKDGCNNPQYTLNELDKIKNIENIDKFYVHQNDIGKEPWLFEKPENKEIITKLLKFCTPLGDLCDIGKGMETGLNEVFVVKPEILSKYQIEKELIRRRIKNGDLRKFEINFLPEEDRWLIYTENIGDIKKFPKAFAYFHIFNKQLKARANYKLGNCEWYRFTCPLNKEIFESDKEKIIVPFMATENRFVYDEGGKEGSYIGLTDTSVLRVKNGINVPTKYLVGLLNSNLLEFIHHRMSKLKRDGYYEYFSKTLSPLPIKLNKDFYKEIIKIVEDIIITKNKLKERPNITDERNNLVNKLTELEKSLNHLVYEIYQITDAEKKIIEESLK